MDSVNDACGVCGDIFSIDDLEQCNGCGMVLCYRCRDDDHSCVADGPPKELPLKETVQ